MHTYAFRFKLGRYKVRYVSAILFRSICIGNTLRQAVKMPNYLKMSSELSVNYRFMHTYAFRIKLEYYKVRYVSANLFHSISIGTTLRQAVKMPN